MENEMNTIENTCRKADLCGDSVIGPVSKNIKKVGFFYHRLHDGGVERVLSQLIPLFIDWGYETFLFVEETSADDYPVPKACTKFLISPSRNADEKQYAEHKKELRKALAVSGAEVLLYQATSSPWFKSDLLLARSMGVFVVGCMHELAAVPLFFGCGEDFLRKLEVLRLADGVQTITRGDEKFLRAIGIGAHYVPNPASEPVGKGTEEKNTILWVGRLDSVQKRPEQAVSIMERVLRSVPTARLYIVGRGETAETDAQIRAYVEERGLGGAVVLCGYCSDMAAYYAGASLFLVTSAYEVAPMALAEAMSYALPAVVYEMPYVEALRDNGGCMIVGQEDEAAAADAIIKILKDDALREKMSRAALAKANALYAADLRAAWENLFSSFGAQLKETEEEKDLRVGIETMLDFYARGLKKPAFCEERGQADVTPPRHSLAKRAAKFWVQYGTFALIRRGMLYIYRRLRNRRARR